MLQKTPLSNPWRDCQTLDTVKAGVKVGPQSADGVEAYVFQNSGVMVLIGRGTPRGHACMCVRFAMHQAQHE